ncbi:hypothetical protein ACE2AJ_15255 [Aquihabitans daechungensis]|uniref:bestrophin-like domain n=1 Tax=Aquihabitans daechungensis TaxID=1052257 RepID=UPI003BA33F8B
MTPLVDGSPWLVLAVTLVVCGALAVGFRILLRHHLGDDLAAASPIASPLMPALGAVFALLAATTIGAEASQFRSAGDDVSAEAAAASRLAWASTTPGVDTDAISDDLAAYLRATRSTEWHDGDRDGSPETIAALTKLERTVRAESVSTTLGSAQAGELLTSLDALTSLRRQRLAHATNQLPEGYLIVVLASGLALVANSAALAVAQRRRVAMLTTGLVVVVSLSLALLIAISSPFEGGFVVDGSPIDAVRSNIESGMFTS